MSLIDDLLDDIESERQEGILQTYINFAHKQRWGFARFKKLLELNLNLELVPEYKKMDEDDFVKEYHTFAEIMYNDKESFDIKNYLWETYNVDPQNYKPVEYAGTKRR